MLGPVRHTLSLWQGKSRPSWALPPALKRKRQTLFPSSAAGTEAPGDWSYSYASGKGLLADRGKVLRHPDGKAMGSPGHPGYRLSDGKLRAGDFDPEGLHKVEEQPMLERP